MTIKALTLLTLSTLFLLGSGLRLNDDCGDVFFFDITQLECIACPGAQIQANDKTSCTCAPGDRDDTGNNIEFVRNCSDCPEDQYPSREGTHCTTCPDDGPYDETIRDCNCPVGFIIVETLADNGTGTKACVECEGATIPGGREFNPRTANGYYQCVSCLKGQRAVDGVCQCEENYIDATAFCVEESEVRPYFVEYDTESANNIRYRDIESGTSAEQTLTSDAIDHYYEQGVAGCLVFDDPQYCSLLANLCVLNFGDLDSTVCRLYRDEVQVTAGDSVRDPILYVDDLEPYDPDSLNLKVSLGDNPITGYVHVMPFYLATYNLDGSFVGFEELGGQLQFCPHFLDEEEVYKNFGTTYENNCDIDLQDIVDSDPGYFYELYLRDNSDELIPIPVVIDNLHNADGSTPNDGSSESDWVMMYRFFLFDNLGGVTGAENGEFRTADPSYITYAKDIRLHIELKMDVDAEINLPMLFIEYKTRSTSNLGTTGVDFLVEYTMDLDNFEQAILIIFIVLTIYSAFYSVLKFYVFHKASPRDYVELFENYGAYMLINMVTIVLKTWAHLMFWLLWCISAYWFVTFKLQTEAFILLPPENTMSEKYLAFRVLYWIVLAIFAFGIVKMIVDQTRSAIFFIDWEPPQKVLQKGHLIDKTSVWRTLFVANEFDELQTWRYVWVEASIFLLVFLLNGWQWENLAYSQPAMDTDDLSSPRNSVLLFFLSTFLYLIITLPQFAFKQLFARWYPTKLNTFNDLCQVANISVFMLDKPFHGYYIEGISEAGQAEGDADDLRRCLDGETNHPRPTGLSGGDPNVLKSFELYPSKDLVEMLDRMYEGEDLVQTRHQSEEMENFGAGEHHQSKKSSEELRKEMNKVLKDHFKRVTTSGASVQEKMLAQRWLGFPPSADGSSLSNTSVFYRDNWNSYQNIFFSGKDYELILFDIMIFNTAYLWFGNSVIAAIITYGITWAYTALRAMLGETNLARRTMIDSRFLVQSDQNSALRSLFLPLRVALLEDISAAGYRES